MTLDPQETDPPGPENPPTSGWPGKSLNITLILLIFMVGLFVGFAGRPFLDNMAGIDARTQTAADAIGLDPAALAPPAAAPTLAVASAVAEAALPNVRHFYGEPDAPITLIEFGDFL